MNSLKVLLKELDFFGAEIQLNIHQNTKFKSLFGGFISLISIVIIFLIILFGIFDLVHKQNLTIQMKQVHHLSPESSQLKRSNFMFGLKISDPLKSRLNITNSTLFSYSLQQIDDLAQQDGSKIRNIPQEYSLETCTYEHFANVDFSIEPQPQFSDYLCFPLNYTFKLAGTFNSELFQFAKIKVKICSNSTKCYSDEQIKQLLNSDSFQLSTIILSSLINPSNSENVISNFIFTDFYLQTTPYQEQYADLFLESNELSTDGSVLPVLSEITKSKYWTFQLQNLRQYTIPHNEFSNFFTLNLRTAQSITNTLIQYQKVDEFLSYIGGIMKILTSVLGVFALTYNQLGLKIELANNLYDFNLPYTNEDGEIEFTKDHLKQFLDKQISRVQTIVSKLKSSTQKIVNVRKLMFGTFQSQRKLQTTNYKNGNDSPHINEQQTPKDGLPQLIEIEQLQSTFLDNTLTEVLVSKKQIELGFDFLINYIFCLKYFKKLNFRRRLINQCDNMISQDLDIVLIMSKIQQVSKLKRILLSKEQLNLFHYCPKPVVEVDKQFYFLRTLKENTKKKRNKSYSGKFHSYKDKAKMLKLYNAFKIVKQDNSLMNQRLIDQLGKRINKIFESALQISIIYQSHQETIKKIPQALKVKTMNEPQIGHLLSDIYRDGKKYIEDDGEQVEF